MNRRELIKYGVAAGVVLALPSVARATYDITWSNGAVSTIEIPEPAYYITYKETWKKIGDNPKQFLKILSRDGKVLSQKQYDSCSVLEWSKNGVTYVSNMYRVYANGDTIGYPFYIGMFNTP